MATEVDDRAVNDRIAQAERLILPVASRLHARLGRGESLDDLCSMGRPAALEAARKWDGRGSFPAFTAQRIKWAILDGVRREQRSRPPRDRRFAIELAMVASVERAADALVRVEDREGGASEDQRASLDAMLRNAAVAYTLERSAAAGDLAVVADARIDVDDDVERMRMRRAVLELPGAERAVVERYTYAEETFEEISEGLGMKRSTVFGLYWRAVERLRKLFESAEPEPG